MLYADKLKLMMRISPVVRGICVLLAALMIAPIAGQSVADRENALKAGFLYNFLSYVEWPQKGSDPADSPFVVGIIGDDALPIVTASLVGKSVKGRRIDVRKVEDIKSLGAYHVVFISASEEPRLRQILDEAKNSAVLTVGEVSGFLREGGVINL